MQFRETIVHGAYVIEPKRIVDERGFFARQWCQEVLASRGLESAIAQINTGLNMRAGTLRGLHFQRAPHAEVKIAHCPRGSVFDVVLDLRPESPSYLRWHGEVLSGANLFALYLPEGCAHGYVALEDDSLLTYFASRPYSPEHATGVRYDDPAFRLEWPIEPGIISKADRSWPTYQTGSS